MSAAVVRVREGRPMVDAIRRVYLYLSARRCERRAAVAVAAGLPAEAHRWAEAAEKYISRLEHLS